MSGLEQLDVSGPEHLREALTNCEDPLATIEEFQTQNCVLLPSLKPALLLLDLHEVKRVDFHRSIMEDLRERLLARIGELASSEDRSRFRTLGDMLERSLPAIKVPELQPVVLTIMKHIPNLKGEYLKMLLDDPELYNAADVNVKQQIWQGNQAKFGDEISSLLSQYVEVQEQILFKSGSDKDFFTQPPKARRQHTVLLDIVKMIGKNIRLYDMVLQFLRTLFLRTRNVHYCTLRAELLMTFHDMKVTDIFQEDPCYKFTWCLDACIQEGVVDSKRAKELVGFLDGVRKGHEEILGDLAMILCDPHAVHTVGLSIVQSLSLSLLSDSLPRNNEDIVFLFRLLSLGLEAWNIIENQKFVESRMSHTLITRFLPCILSVMVDDANVQLSKSTEDIVLPEYMTDACEGNSVATVVFVYYMCDVLARSSQQQALCLRLLTALASCERDAVQSDGVQHYLVSSLMRQAESFNNSDFCEAVFDRFFLPALSNENVCRHFARLLGGIHKRLTTSRLNELVSELYSSASSHGKDVQKAVDSLRDEIDNSNQPMDT